MKENFVTFSRGCSESVVLPLPNEAILPRSIFSRLPSSEVLSSNSLKANAIVLLITSVLIVFVEANVY